MQRWFNLNSASFLLQRVFSSLSASSYLYHSWDVAFSMETGMVNVLLSYKTCAENEHLVIPKLYV